MAGFCLLHIRNGKNNTFTTNYKSCVSYSTWQKMHLNFLQLKSGVMDK